MTRLLTTGYETGDVNEAGVSNVAGFATMAVVSSTPAPRAGSYCLKLGATNSSSNNAYKTFALPAAKSEVWVRFAFLSHLLTGGGAVTIAQMNDSTSAVQVILTYSTTDGLLRAYAGTFTTLLGVSSAGFTADSWHVIEWREQILSATTGALEVWLDGTRVINFSGDTSNTAVLSVSSVLLGTMGNNVQTGAYAAFDDIAINDVAGTINNGRPGDGRVVLLVPNGAGSSSVWTRGGTDTGANYSQTNELPPSMAQYVASATVADRDLYALGDLGMAIDSINVVEELVLAQNSDAGAGSLGLTIKSGATINEATAQPLGTSPTYYVARYETDPNTSAAWTQAAVNALEAGMTVR